MITILSYGNDHVYKYIVPISDLQKKQNEKKIGCQKIKITSHKKFGPKVQGTTTATAPPHHCVILLQHGEGIPCGRHLPRWGQQGW